MNYLDPNRYAAYSAVPHDSWDAPSGFLQSMWNVAQYGSSLVSPILGAGIGLVGNIAGQMFQNNTQEEFYRKYMSPKARMEQMMEAGINPNAAAQGISGSSAPQMTAAAPSSAMTGIGEQLGQSVNSALTASAIKAGIRKTDSETDLTNSLNVEKQTTNKYVDAMQQASLYKLVQDGKVSEENAKILAVDAYYRGPQASAHLAQTYAQIDQIAAQTTNLQQEYFNLLAEEYATMQAGNLSNAQIHKVFSDIGLNNAMINEIEHRIDNIDMNTMLQAQEISESKARERVARVNAQTREKYLNIWNSTGYNMESDVNSNIYQFVMSGQSNKAKSLLNATQAVVMNYGEARFNSKDYNMDKAVEIIGDFTRMFNFSNYSGQTTSYSNKVPYVRPGQGSLQGILY